MKWEETLWAELDALTHSEQIIATGEMIAHVNQQILPRLASRRREQVLAMLAEAGMDATKVAETVGMRRVTVLRLASEGRAEARGNHEVPG